jgi:hypothetical protein
MAGNNMNFCGCGSGTAKKTTPRGPVVDIKNLENGVLVELNSAEVKKSDMEKSIENCNAGKCDCLSDSQKARIKSISLKEGDFGSLTVEIEGDIDKEEIKQAMEKAAKNQKNGSCC